MAGSKWLDGYSGQSTDELLSLEEEYRIDSLVVAFEQAIDQKAAHAGSDSLSQEERIVLAVEALEREVNNGGYHQFFANSSREFTPIIVDALNRIGCPAAASLTQRAISALALPGPVSTEAIDQAIGEENHERDAALDACDHTYYTSVGDLAGPLFAFLKANRHMIRLPN